MATKYQCEKAIKQLIEKGSDDPNVQGYGIGRAKDYGLDDEVGYVVLVYTETAPKKITPAEKIKADPADTAKRKSAPVPKAATTAAKKTAARAKPIKKVPGAGKKGQRKTVQQAQKPKAIQKAKSVAGSKPPIKAKKTKLPSMDKGTKTAEKPKAEAAPAEPLYPDKVETTSRKKKIQVPLEYIETGKFGFS